MGELREYKINGTIIIGIDHGYGNIKTARRVFPTSVQKMDEAPAISSEYIEYNGSFYIIEEDHKTFVEEKQMDEDNYTGFLLKYTSLLPVSVFSMKYIGCRDLTECLRLII